MSGPRSKLKVKTAIPMVWPPSYLRSECAELSLDLLGANKKDHAV